MWQRNVSTRGNVCLGWQMSLFQPGTEVEVGLDRLKLRKIHSALIIDFIIDLIRFFAFANGEQSKFYASSINKHVTFQPLCLARMTAMENPLMCSSLAAKVFPTLSRGGTLHKTLLNCKSMWNRTRLTMNKCAFQSLKAKFKKRRIF